MLNLRGPIDIGRGYKAIERFRSCAPTMPPLAGFKVPKARKRHAGLFRVATHCELRVFPE